MMKKILLSALFALFITSAFAQSYENLVKEDWAQFGRYATANSEVSVSPKVVYMGDSITERWVKAHPDFFNNNNFAGRGISGQTTSEMLCRFRPDVIELHPKYVAIMAGTNDIAMNNGNISLENMLDNIISMCELAKANKIKVLLCSVPPCKQFPWRLQAECRDRIPAFNTMLKEYAQNTKGVTYIDYFSALTDGNNACIEKYTLDNCHLTPAGYDVIEAIILNYIK